MKRFQDLSEPEVLALAISLEEEDERVYAEFAAGLAESFPGTAAVFEGMQAEESVHRRRLTELFKTKFGNHIPLIRRQDVKGFVQRKPIWLVKPLGIDTVRQHAAIMEMETRKFYEMAAAKSQDVDIRKLLDDLAMAERKHEHDAERLTEKMLGQEALEAERDTQRRLFILQIIQPGLAGLMDGSVSTLAPVFAAAVATRDSWEAFLVGLAASIGAGISMGFAEALSDDGSVTGRGLPWFRGFICGLMTTIGGIGHTLPFLIKSYNLAIMLAFAVVAVELAIITWIRSRYMNTPVVSAAMQVGLGGALVFLTGLLIGSS